ncbi:phage holin family protein [Carboxydothermus pertinax]|uniref:Membrane protein n=1 Tax=Carboxydothermus pertinax TaxID=870242 RepID=A0A1L8CT62_9THEO|nr:phage holin family protein [Carboxydothermus pertinax]GAV22034.1 membrane protein [Carboxydothermus pertinax]
MATVVKTLISAITLIGVSILTPGFTVKGGIVGALIAAIVISLLNYLAGQIIGEKGRGFTGFIVAVLVLLLARYLVPKYLVVTVPGAIIAALIIGLVDKFIPTTLR